MNNIKKLAKVTDKSEKFSGWLIGDNIEDLESAFLENYDTENHEIDLDMISDVIELQKPEGCGFNMANDKNGDPVLFKFI